MNKKTKEKIPSTVRNSVWNIYIGLEKKKGTCFCCNTEDISIANFQCGHINSEKNGGQVTINNLRPICSQCNSSMGTKNMEIFMEKYGFIKNKNWNGLMKKETIKIVEPNVSNNIIADLSKTELKQILYKYYSKNNNIKTKQLMIKKINEIKHFIYREYLEFRLNNLTLLTIKKICSDHEIKKVGKKKELIGQLVNKNINISDYTDRYSCKENTENKKEHTCYDCRAKEQESDDDSDVSSDDDDTDNESCGDDEFEKISVDNITDLSVSELKNILQLYNKKNIKTNDKALLVSMINSTKTFVYKEYLINKLKHMTIPTIKKICGDYGLKKTLKKQELIDQLVKMNFNISDYTNKYGCGNNTKNEKTHKCYECENE